MNKIKAVAVLEAILFSVMMCFTAFASDEVYSAPADSDWQVRHYSDNGQLQDDFYLWCVVTGTAVDYPSGDYSREVNMLFAAEKDGSFSFAIFSDYYQNGLNAITDRDCTNPIYLATGMGLNFETTITQPSQSIYWSFDDDNLVGGMSVNEIILTEARTNGFIQMQIPLLGYEEREQTLLYFELDFAGSGFRKIYDWAKEIDWKQPVLQPQSEQSDTDSADSDWEVFHYYNNNNEQLQDDFFLSHVVTGTAVDVPSGDNSREVMMLLTAEKNGCFSFVIYSDYYQNGLDAFADEDFINPIYLAFGMGLEFETTITQSPQDIFWYFDNDTLIGGMSVNELILAEARTNGFIQMQISFFGYEGREQTLLSFDLDFAESNFRKLYDWAEEVSWNQPLPQQQSVQSDTAPAAGYSSSQVTPQNNGYTNMEILTICNNYIDTYNACCPFIDQFLDVAGLDGWLAPFLGGTLVGFSGAEYFNAFLEARTAMEKLDQSLMTLEQRSYYLNAKSSVDSTTLGEILTIINYLNN